MPRIQTNQIELEYEQFGPASGDPLLLIMGLGAQMIHWDEEFIGLFVDRGYHVTRFDNRDVGLSTKLEAAGPVNVLQVMQQARSGEKPDVPYTLDDMADDTAGLLDGLEIDAAHVVGASMGGMVAQTLAIRHPARVRSMVSIMSSTGNPDLPPAKPEAMAMLMRPPADSREAAIENTLVARRLLAGTVHAFDEERARANAERAYDRCFYPVGQGRQTAAIMAHGSRTDALSKLDVPTLVIHGDADPLVPIEGGQDTARCVPGADLMIVEGMGHDLPPAAWTRIVDAIHVHTEKARH
ncbi:MAG: alpha/beta hydrolase [Deltaproteobacteria bacterium]|nr:alpha/beta hydrolase [Deltaproteobacteria bacterium]